MVKRKVVKITAPNLAAMKNKVKYIPGNYVVDYAQVISKTWEVHLKEGKSRKKPKKKRKK